MILPRRQSHYKRWLTRTSHCFTSGRIWFVPKCVEYFQWRRFSVKKINVFLVKNKWCRTKMLSAIWMCVFFAANQHDATNACMTIAECDWMCNLNMHFIYNCTAVKTHQHRECFNIYWFSRSHRNFIIHMNVSYRQTTLTNMSHSHGYNHTRRELRFQWEFLKAQKKKQMYNSFIYIYAMNVVRMKRKI